MRNATGYADKRGEWRLSCAVVKEGVPREIKEVKWFRNGEDISNQNGFDTVGVMDLLIEVGFLMFHFQMWRK